ncbi:tripartite tricarboxylate transporter substrate binding protein [Variovorax sp. E3]|uniref:Bug family tripartite tricarboxylate transporter substrate binding protein n=1 Tax=Variovorax sp. E3 TaxID=1914993 RepID=UPI0018DCC9EF|nr:tripartite tricarboxylate transporter substrate binding protein [Variovorax sp. E3]
MSKSKWPQRMKLIAILAIGTATLPHAAVAAPYPDKAIPLKIVVPFGAGSAVDAVGRALGRAITEVSGLNVVVDNKPGADSVIGMQAVHQAPSDGYTILLVSSSTPVLNPLILPKQPLEIERDFVAISAVAKNYPAVFNVGPSTPFKSVLEFIAAAKDSPGKYTYASATTTSLLAGQLFESVAGIRLVNIPYKTITSAVVGVAAGEVDLLITDPGSVKAQWDSGRIRPLAVGAPSRLRSFPQIPTLLETGIHYELPAWFATYFNSKTPPERVAAMRDIVRKAVQSPDFSSALNRFYIEPFDIAGDELTALTKKDVESWGRVVRESKAREKK